MSVLAQLSLRLLGGRAEGVHLVPSANGMNPARPRLESRLACTSRQARALDGLLRLALSGSKVSLQLVVCEGNLDAPSVRASSGCAYCWLETICARLAADSHARCPPMHVCTCSPRAVACVCVAVQ